MNETVLVYDDDCGFCTWWAEWFDDRSDVRLVGFTDVWPELRERLPENYEACSHLVTDEAVYSCGASIEQALIRTTAGDAARPAVDFFREFDAYGSLREWGYRRVADNRSFWGQFLSETPPARRAESDDGP